MGESDAKIAEERTSRFEEIVQDEFNKFRSGHPKGRRMRLMHYRHGSRNEDGTLDWYGELRGEIKRFHILKSDGLLFTLTHDIGTKRKPDYFFTIIHPKSITRDEEKNIVGEPRYDFRHLHGKLIGPLGQEFFPYAENIYNRLVNEGIVLHYDGQIYWQGSGPELRDDRGNVYILSTTKPFLRKGIKESIRF